MIEIVYGANVFSGNFRGSPLGTVITASKDILNVKYSSEELDAYVNDKAVAPDHNLQDGDRVELIKVRGYKGGEVLTQKEWLEFYDRPEDDWQWCKDHGMHVDRHENGLEVVCRREAIRWNSRLKYHLAGEPILLARITDLEQQISEAGKRKLRSLSPEHRAIYDAASESEPLTGEALLGKMNRVCNSNAKGILSKLVQLELFVTTGKGYLKVGLPAQDEDSASQD